MHKNQCNDSLGTGGFGGFGRSYTCGFHPFDLSIDITFGQLIANSGFPAKRTSGRLCCTYYHSYMEIYLSNVRKTPTPPYTEGEFLRIKGENKGFFALGRVQTFTLDGGETALAVKPIKKFVL